MEFEEIILPPFKVKEEDDGDHSKFLERLFDSSGFRVYNKDGVEIDPVTREPK